MVVLNSRFALALTVFPQFQKLRLRWSMVFTKEFEFQFQKFITSLLRNLIFQPSEAPLSMVLQNLSKLISFHYWVPKDLTNFECWFWNFHTLNYNTPGALYWLAKLSKADQSTKGISWVKDGRRRRKYWKCSERWASRAPNPHPDLNRVKPYHKFSSSTSSPPMFSCLEFPVWHLQSEQ